MLFTFYALQVLIDNIKEFAPIIYTPTVGLVCENYSGLFRRPRGMYFSAKDKGEMMFSGQEECWRTERMAAMEPRR